MNLNFFLLVLCGSLFGLSLRLFIVKKFKTKICLTVNNIALINIISSLITGILLALDIKQGNLYFLLSIGFLGCFILGSLGFITGLWAEKFDHTATITNFIVTPLTFLSGTFFTIDKLPAFFKSISLMNPFFYIIDGFRYGFLGKSDGSIFFGLIYLSILSFLMWYLAFYLFKKGYKIKS